MTPPIPGQPTATVDWRDRWMRRPWWWATGLAFVLTTLIIFGLRPFLRHEAPAPDVMAQLPPFELIDANGNPFGTEELAGKVWLADFFFTSCPSICTQLTEQMVKLQGAFEREGVKAQLVSISVDPQNDTPNRLRQYAAKHGADPERWHFLTGTPEAIRAVVVDGFQTHLGEPELKGKDIVDIAHASYFVLVDEDGGIRGYYRALDDEELSRAFHETKNLLRERAQ